MLFSEGNFNKRQPIEKKLVRCPKCAFCSGHKIVEHLFIQCPFAKLVWQVVHFTYNIPPPTNIKNIFGRWLIGIDKK
jgi:hypothetical protein